MPEGYTVNRDDRSAHVERICLRCSRRPTELTDLFAARMSCCQRREDRTVNWFAASSLCWPGTISDDCIRPLRGLMSVHCGSRAISESFIVQVPSFLVKGGVLFPIHSSIRPARDTIEMRALAIVRSTQWGK